MPVPGGHLEVQRVGEPPTVLPLGATTIRIGRGRDAELHVADPHVSKRHAEIRVDGEDHVVADCGSLAGVFVNGQKVERHRLHDGDVIELGAHVPLRITVRRAAKMRPDTTLIAAVEPADSNGLGRLARFFEFSQKLGGGFTLDEVLQDVVDLAIEVTHAERGLVLLQRADGSLETRVARGANGRTLPTTGLRISDTLVQKALASGQPTIVADVDQDADLALAASIVSLELRSAVLLPLVHFVAAPDAATASSATFGLVYLDSRRLRGGFDGFDLGILARLARDASSVVENARLLREAEQRRRIEQEVRMASEVQAALMPEHFRSTPAWDIAGSCVPCHELGGDYVDQFDLGGGRTALVVADVAGKGIAASLLAATLQGALAAEMHRGGPLGEAVERVNRVHCRLAPVGKFVTLAVAVLDPDGCVEIVNAGHCPVLVVHADTVTTLPGDGMALGLSDEATYQSSTVQLRAGDTLALYSDGIVECLGPDHELFDESRLAASLQAHRRADAAGILAGIVRDVDTFRKEVANSDDRSLIVVRAR
ncbi:MAG: SpoIIE family protein phosphatase [Planctomycetes bacterium]|nr:SpoIIE family protein phosphatase [Planctomycetota bacterium]